MLNKELLNEFTITSFAEFHEVVKQCLEPSYWLFRGQENSSWDLRPKCGRGYFKNRNDKEIFESWKQKSYEYSDWHPDENWNWLALAQHHGLATRLLDWSANPLVAVFFACQNESVDGVIFAYLGGKRILEKSFKQSDPWDVIEPFVFHPYLKSRRVANQKGSFTISGNPYICFSTQIRDNEKLLKIKICKHYKRKFLFELSLYGIDWSFIYPDLDGLSKHINWQVEYGEKYLK